MSSSFERYLQPIDRLHEHLPYMSELPPVTFEMRTVISALQWLTTAPETHAGRAGQFGSSAGYVVCELAGSNPEVEGLLSPQGGEFRLPKEGVYFGRIDHFKNVLATPDFRVIPDRSTDEPTEKPFRLIDVNDARSFDDKIHVTVCSQCSNPDAALWHGGAWVNVRRLARESDERLARMARNARRVLTHHAVETTDSEGY